MLAALLFVLDTEAPNGFDKDEDPNGDLPNGFDVVAVVVVVVVEFVEVGAPKPVDPKAPFTLAPNPDCPNAPPPPPVLPKPEEVLLLLFPCEEEKGEELMT